MESPVIGISWPGFHEERWAKDERALRAALAKFGMVPRFSVIEDAAQDRALTGADGASESLRQVDHIETFISHRVQAIIILPQDATTAIPALRKAMRTGIPVVVYDRIMELPGAIYVSFDFRKVGQQIARAIVGIQPTGAFVIMNGSQIDPVAHIIRAGMMDILQPAIDRGDIHIAAEAFTDGWLPEKARCNMERILADLDGRIDAVVAANDGTGLACAQVLLANGRRGVPISGHDGDERVLQYIGNGLMTVCAWKDARLLAAKAADVLSSILAGTRVDDIPGSMEWTGPSGAKMRAVLLTPIPITRQNLDLVIASEWTTADRVYCPVESAS